MPRVYIKTYGCQMNVRDSEQVAKMFVDRGYTMTPSEDDADVILINSCSVRDQAEQKALGKMGMAGRQRQRNPNIVFGLMGCMAQSRGAELLDNLPHLNLVAGTQKYHAVVDHVEPIVSKHAERDMDDLRVSIVDTDD
jgi:tRNA-2-methylthio-N6-dimethylallyladenosine synthase